MSQLNLKPNFDSNVCTCVTFFWCNHFINNHIMFDHCCFTNTPFFLNMAVIKSFNTTLCRFFECVLIFDLSECIQDPHFHSLLLDFSARSKATPQLRSDSVLNLLL